MRRVAVPALLLVVLLVAYATRWHVVANKTDQYGVTKWVRDRWTGEVWIRSYELNGFTDVPASVASSLEWKTAPHLAALGDPRVRLRDYLTRANIAVLGASALWLLIRLVRKPPNKEAPPERTPRF